MLKEPKDICEVGKYSKEALDRFHKVYGKQFGASTLADYENKLIKLHKDILSQYQNDGGDDSDSDSFDAEQNAFIGIADDSTEINKIVHALNL